jgi:hypothetical protein
MGESRIAYCEEKYSLMDAFLEVVRELSALHAQQVQAVMDSDPDFARFDLLIYMMNERKEQAKYALLAHIEAHRC